MKSSIGSTTGRSDISNRLKKRNRKPPACAPCRARKLRCDRTLPSCNNCLSRPDVEHCDYSNPRHSRCGGRRSCRSELATAPAPAAGPAHPPTPPELPDAAEDEEEEEEGDDDGGSQNAGEGERSERASEKTMREKLERLERMIASLMESKACRKQSGAGSCSGKKLQKERQPSDDGVKSLAASTSTMQRLLGPREGESMWSTLLNEKIQRWQQGLSRHQSASPASASMADLPEKT